MKNAALILLILAAGVMIYIRVAPSDPAVWHVDPRTAERPDRGGVLLLPGDATAKVYPVPPEALMTAFDSVAMAQPRVSRLAGRVQDSHVTYVARSKLMGYPDYISVRAVPAEGGAALAVYSRQRFGTEDMGVNAARLTDWLQKLDRALGR